MTTVNILGTEYKVIREPFADKDIDGYCDYTSREIRIRDDNVNEVGDFDELMRKQLRHEIIHCINELPERKNDMKAMLSQPMAGKTDEEIVATREKAIKVLEGKGYEIVNTLFTDEWYSNESMKERGVVQIPLCFLAKSLENMSLCHAAYFCKGWENARGYFTWF